MALPELHSFERDLKNVPPEGSNAPPRSIRAKDLDENFQKVTVLESEEDPPAYRVRYTKDGTVLEDFNVLPEGAGRGDLLAWNGTEWVVLPAIQSATLHVLTIQNGSLAWTSTQDC